VLPIPKCLSQRSTKEITLAHDSNYFFAIIVQNREMPDPPEIHHVVGERQFLVALQRGHIWRHHVFDSCHFFRLLCL
jgi:hypothetical protein